MHDCDDDCDDYSFQIGDLVCLVDEERLNDGVPITTVRPFLIVEKYRSHYWDNKLVYRLEYGELIITRSATSLSLIAKTKVL